MVEVPGSSRPERRAVATTRETARSSWLGGVALVLGAVLLVVEFVLDTFVVQVQAYEGPAALLTVVSNSLWIPWRVVFLAAPVVLAVGLASVAVDVYREGERRLAAAAGASLGLSVVLFVQEFVIAAIAAPSLFSRPRGTGLSQADVQLVLMSYQSIGIALLAVAAVALGVSVVLLSVGLHRTGRSSPVLAAAGVVAGGIVALGGVGRVVDVPLGRFVQLSLFAFVVLWFLALGASTLRTTEAA